MATQSGQANEGRCNIFIELFDELANPPFSDPDGKSFGLASPFTRLIFPFDQVSDLEPDLERGPAGF